jgi:mRNA-degrading endonuclease RelE of RelBE toxin-antitoxin system
LDLINWNLEFKQGWDEHFKHFDKAIQSRIIKKLEQMKSPLQGRGLNSSNYKVEEVGGYRIAYIEDQNSHTKRIHFVGNHKQYEQWYSKPLLT